MMAAVGITLLFAFTFFLPWLYRELRQGQSALVAYWFTVMAHYLAAIISAYVFYLPGVGPDAEDYHLVGMDVAASGNWMFAVGQIFYEQFLGMVYLFFASSLMLGQQFSILAYALSCVVLLKILKLLCLYEFRVPVILVYGLLPTMVLLGSVTMPESFQILFLMLMVYFGIKACLESDSLKNIILMILFSVIMGLFHKALIVYSIIGILIILWVWVLSRTESWSLSKQRLKVFSAVLGFVVLLFSVVVITVGLNKFGALSWIVDIGPIESIRIIRDGAPNTRATYGVPMETDSVFAIVTSSISMLLHYLFAPFPWQVHRVIDFYAFSESLLRLVLIYCSIIMFMRSKGQIKKIMGMMLVLYFSVAILWALGTTNYGTSIRHNIVHYWLIVVMGMPVLVSNARRFLRVLVLPDREVYVER